MLNVCCVLRIMLRIVSSYKYCSIILSIPDLNGGLVVMKSYLTAESTQ